MSHHKLAASVQGLQSSAIRELLKQSKMAGVISLGAVFLTRRSSIGRGYRWRLTRYFPLTLAKRSSMA